MAVKRSIRHSLHTQGINAAWEYMGFVTVLRYLSAPVMYIHGYYCQDTIVRFELDVNGTPASVEWINTNATPTDINVVVAEMVSELNTLAGVTASAAPGSTVIRIAQLNVNIDNITIFPKGAGYVVGLLLSDGPNALLANATERLRWQ